MVKSWPGQKCDGSSDMVDLDLESLRSDWNEIGYGGSSLGQPSRMGSSRDIKIAHCGLETEPDTGLCLLTLHHKDLLSTRRDVDIPGIENGGLENLKKCASKTLSSMRSLMAEFSNLKITESERRKIKSHMNHVEKAVRNLFHRRIIKLQNNPYLFLGHSNEPIADDNYTEIFKMAEKEWLKTAANSKAFSQLLDIKDHPKRRVMFKKWCDIMLKLFVDLKKHEVIPEENLAEFLNKDDQGKFIGFYICKRSFPEHDLHAAYLNFNIKLSLQEGSPLMNAQYVSNFFDTVVDKDTWEKIEFNCLNSLVEKNSQYNQEQGITHENLYFIEIKRIFDDLNPEVNTPESLQPKIKGFFELLVGYISLQIISEDDFLTDDDLWELKILHGMLIHLIRFHVNDLPPQFLQEFMKSNDFYLVRLFEETMGLLSNLFHFFHVLSKDVFQTSKSALMDEELSEMFNFSTLLIDSNQSRNFSNFDHVPEEEIQCLKSLEDLNILDARLTEIHTELIAQVLGDSESEAVKNSRAKYKKQLGIYCSHLDRIAMKMYQWTSDVQDPKCFRAHAAFEKLFLDVYFKKIRLGRLHKLFN
ncbi:hypothetical protein PGTUg99_034520 [Puccinia graminis f. sp. tritici]|uniref:Uncharacterized protein n=1 Tax=Puccinia graminis f. sp. tritici TaxID=56615 RepID=A0A5B0MES6_PUCGR|nr:hypothetical protein PGTUg99_034520 [Puccinia graminis f. sp. tritici]